VNIDNTTNKIYDLVIFFDRNAGGTEPSAFLESLKLNKNVTVIP
jgi:hypothetical protein